MGYRRSIIARSKLFYQQHQRFSPSFSHISSSNREELPAKSICRNSEIRSHFLIPRNNASNSLLSGNVSRLMRSEVPAGYGLIFHRNMSKVAFDIEVVHDAEDFNGMAGVVTDKVVEAAPVVNEVAIAAADSFAPVAAYQYLIDYVHCYTGFEWWASIAAATLLIHFIDLSFYIHVLKFPPKDYLPLLRSQLVALLKCLKNLDNMEQAGLECVKALAILSKMFKQQRFNAIFHVNKLFLFFAILNMAEKVPSFTTGGTLWFTDLTTPNRMYLPILYVLINLIRLELDPGLYFGGVVPSSKSLLLIFSVPTLLVTVLAGFPTAVYCFGITSNLFSILAYGIALRDPRVQKLLGISMKLKPPSTHK